MPTPCPKGKEAFASPPARAARSEAVVFYNPRTMQGVAVLWQATPHFASACTFVVPTAKSALFLALLAFLCGPSHHVVCGNRGCAPPSSIRLCPLVRKNRQQRGTMRRCLTTTTTTTGGEYCREWVIDWLLVVPPLTAILPPWSARRSSCPQGVFASRTVRVAIVYLDKQSRSTKSSRTVGAVRRLSQGGPQQAPVLQRPHQHRGEHDTIP